MLASVNVPTMPQPEAYIGNGHKLFDEKGNITEQSTADFLKKFLIAFDLWIERNI
ncbi:hypothetical protein D3C81_2297460 [compost metagenome]